MHNVLAHCLARRCQHYSGNGKSELKMTASKHLLHQYNITIICNSKKSFIGHILFSSFEVDLTAPLTDQIGENDPKTTTNFCKVA